MQTQVKQVQQVDDSGQVITKTTQVEGDDSGARQENPPVTSMIARVVWYIASILLILLAFRFVLALLGANPENQFASFIYDVSHPFVAPFFSLFGYDLQYGVSRFEAYTLVAMFVYLVIASLIARLVTLPRDARADA